ncbi:DUF2927 domain-containing protein [Palleronia caenipelagi]
MRRFPVRRAAPPQRANADMAADFLDLFFQLESGRNLPAFTRFEGPISVRVVGPTSPTLERDLTDLLTRLRREAGISITRVPAAQAASITVQVIPSRALQNAVPQAACFVVPRVQSWTEFEAARSGNRLDWATLPRRDRVTVFLPGDVAPQDQRDCLHEEMAQALGPLNDLFRLTDSVFNDDNFVNVLTGFDMLVLRATYAPELRSGMGRDDVAARLPALLSRLNPVGDTIQSKQRAATDPDWINQIQRALSLSGRQSPRVRAARRAITIARRNGWADNRLAFSHFALGRVVLNEDPEAALESFLRAGRIYGADPLTRLHAAHVALQMTAFALSAGVPEDAVRLVDAHAPAARMGENASLLASLLLLKAEALRELGRDTEARTIRREALGYARYGFGDADIVRRHAEEIATIPPS